jgi:hypothetical protein
MMLVVVMYGLTTPSRAEEKNGLSVAVTKKTLDRNDTRNYYYSDRIDRTQGLKATIKNVSFKEMPAGEVSWTILVRKYYGGTPEGYRGTEPLKSLKQAEAIELVLGAAQIGGYGGYYYTGQVKDKIEHQIIVTQGGTETMRMSSTPGFDQLAKQAVFPTKTAAPPAPKKTAGATPAATPRPLGSGTISR